jgi:hypothetical protein
MMEHLVAILGTFKAKMVVKLDSLPSRIDVLRDKTDANQEELMAIMKANQETVRSPDGCQPRIDEGLPRCDGSLQEIKITESDAVEEHQEVSKGQAAVENIGALDDRSGNQRTAGGPQNPLERWFKDAVVLDTPKGRMLEMRRPAQPKPSNGSEDVTVDASMCVIVNCKVWSRVVSKCSINLNKHFKPRLYALLSCDNIY